MPAVWPFPQGLNGIDPIYFQEKVNNFLFDVSYEQSPFTSFMGTNDSDAISVQTISDAVGSAAVFGRLRQLDFRNPILNDDQVRGIERTYQTDTITVPAEKITFPLIRRNVSVERYASKIQISQNNARALAHLLQRYRDLKTLQSAMTGLYNNTVNGSMPRNSRAVAGNLVAGQANDGKYIYANNAVLTTKLLAAMPDARNTQHRMTVAHIERLRQKALDNYTGENILPTSIRQYNGWDEPVFTLFMSPKVASYLRQDADFKAMHLTRGVQLPFQGSPLIGGYYVGRVSDVECIEIRELGDPTLQLDAKYGWSLLFGRGAWGTFMQTGVELIEEMDKVEDFKSFYARQHVGVKALVFPSINEVVDNADPVKFVEQGIVHSFTRID